MTVRLRNAQRTWFFTHYSGLVPFAVTALAAIVRREVTIRTGVADSVSFSTADDEPLQTIFVGNNPKDAIREPSMGRDDPWSCLVRVHPRLSPLAGDGATVVQLRRHFKMHVIPSHVADAICALRERHGFPDTGHPPANHAAELARIRGAHVLEPDAHEASEALLSAQSSMGAMAVNAAAIASAHLHHVVGGAGSGIVPPAPRPAPSIKVDARPAPAPSIEVALPAAAAAAVNSKGGESEVAAGVEMGPTQTHQRPRHSLPPLVGVPKVAPGAPPSNLSPH